MSRTKIKIKLRLQWSKIYILHNIKGTAVDNSEKNLTELIWND